MSSLKIKKTICYIILIISSITLGITIYAGCAFASNMSRKEEYSWVVERNFDYVWDQIYYKEYNDKLKSEYDSNAGEDYLSYSELEANAEEYYNYYAVYREIINFAENLEMEFDDYWDGDGDVQYEYCSDDFGDFRYMIYSDAADYDSQQLDIMNDFLDFIGVVSVSENIGAVYISENSRESSVQDIVDECNYYIDGSGIDDDVYFYDEYADANFFYCIIVTDADTGKTDIYDNGYDADKEYGQHISANVQSDDYSIEEIKGFTGIDSEIEIIVRDNLQNFQSICTNSKVSIEVDYAIDTEWPSAGCLETLYSSLNNSGEYKYMGYALAGGVVFFVILLIMFIMLTVMAGHRVKKDVPATIKADKALLIIWIIAGGVVLGAVSAICGFIYFYIDEYVDLKSNMFSEMMGSEWLLYVYVAMILITLFHVCFVIYLSVVRRIKTKTFLKTTLIGKIYWAAKKTAVRAKKFIKKFIENKKASVNVLIMAGVFYCVNIFGVILFTAAMCSYEEGIALFIAFLWILINVAAVVFVWRYMVEINTIEETTEQIAAGNQEFKLTEKFLYPSNRRIADNINNIGDGISKAVEASMKNERLKTDLITNVSHDIKTPLTSIINYVRLLKAEDVNDKKIREYINILDEKSERLKILTDDLIEASKLSSGVVELSRSEIDIVELVNQAVGEFKRKFDDKQLVVITDIKKPHIIAYCDGRKIWRVLENLYGNVCKYALSNTRVYIIVEEKEDICISIKNISENQLNFDASELTERFVRGDISRNTEGSGLGLSIAKSIIDRHGGTFEIVLDGDLFKVVIHLPKQLN